MNNSLQLVVTFEGLTVNALGPYGSSWVETPNLDRIASESIIFDRAHVASMSPSEVLQRIFTESDRNLPGSQDCPRILVTDCAATAEIAQPFDFSQCLLIENTDEDVPSPAEDVESTKLAQLFATAMDSLASLSEGPAILWIHSRSLVSRWDAPESLRESDDLVQEEDANCESCVEFPMEISWESDDEVANENTASPDEIETARLSVSPPDVEFDSSCDPDILLAWMTAYGAQVSVIDAMLGLAMNLLQDHCVESGVQASLLLAGTSGFALGEHGWIGPEPREPRSNSMHVPIILHALHLPVCRVQTPVTTDAIAPTLRQLVDQDLQLNGDAPDSSDGSLLAYAAPSEWAAPYDPMSPVVHVEAPNYPHIEMITVSPGWLYLRDDSQREHLFLKPDDRHDYNDVASLETEIVSEFREA